MRNYEIFFLGLKKKGIDALKKKKGDALKKKRKKKKTWL